MRAVDSANSISRFRRNPWKHQKTFRTPLKSLAPFVNGIISAIQPIERAQLTIENVVFEPHSLAELGERHSIEMQFDPKMSLEAQGQAEAADLLQAALSDWIDFLFVPVPKTIAIYADHDEYMTCFSMKRVHLDCIADAAKQQGVNIIEDYQRRF